MMKELYGRQYGGGSGPIKNEGIDLQKYLVLAPSNFTSAQCNLLLQHFGLLASCEVRSTITELGFPLCQERKCGHPEHPYEHVRPEALTLDQVKRASPDRFELDAVVFDVLGLTEEERLEVYKAVAQLVKERLVKARSV